MLNRNAQFLQHADGVIYDSWKGINDAILGYGSAQISKAFYKLLESCARPTLHLSQKKTF